MLAPEKHKPFARRALEGIMYTKPPSKVTVKHMSKASIKSDCEGGFQIELHPVGTGGSYTAAEFVKTLKPR